MFSISLAKVHFISLLLSPFFSMFAWIAWSFHLPLVNDKNNLIIICKHILLTSFFLMINVHFLFLKWVYFKKFFCLVFFMVVRWYIFFFVLTCLEKDSYSLKETCFDELFIAGSNSRVWNHSCFSLFTTLGICKLRNLKWQIEGIRC